MIRNTVYRTGQFLFGEPVRLIELFSALNLLAWAQLLWRQPEILLRETYASFQGLGATIWACLLLIVAIGQLVPVAWRFRQSADLRFVAMTLASGAWLMIAANFISTGVSSTAGANYLLLALTCMVSGVWLA